MKIQNSIHIQRTKNTNGYEVWVGDGSEASVKNYAERIFELDFVARVTSSYKTDDTDDKHKLKRILPLFIELDPRYEGNLTQALESALS